MDQFDLQFDSYINTIIEVLLRRVLHQNHSKDATTIRGRSIEDLKELIRTALLEHLTDKKPRIVLQRYRWLSRSSS